MAVEVEVDQSIKIEQTHADTRIGVVKGHQKLLVVIDAGLKRKLELFMSEECQGSSH